MGRSMKFAQLIISEWANMEFGTNSHLNNSLNKSKGGGVGTPQRKKPVIQRARRGIDGEQGGERAYDSALQLYGSPPTMDIT